MCAGVRVFVYERERMTLKKNFKLTGKMLHSFMFSHRMTAISKSLFGFNDKNLIIIFLIFKNKF